MNDQDNTELAQVNKEELDKAVKAVEALEPNKEEQKQDAPRPL